ncbi:aldehyde dehydrogenase (NAD+) [Pseudomonas sp. URIL14HWK12:I9]|nr:aldehyde dehydrogenase (NAD+) [Pseudomonas sp. URIL14HWK12:I12]PVZ27546.1 aldehyde dehydrogenase (NAD+) [Pseudomonas sp. URIL14HWK12:I10]PVZ38435.1 aldehyde dehydrogenase (NAD+) [Pseudomonas sp. URIL14HWK12:I11]SNZ03367.1 aldehyde dehydrogenase (NAD+) [Pseudomonas sp. URIL14HWK12:I9]
MAFIHVTINGTEGESMKLITRHYINGEFVESHGRETFDLINPSTQELIGRVTLGDEEDTRRAIAAAKEAFKAYSKSAPEERAEYLQRLHDALVARAGEHAQALIQEYGGPSQMAHFLIQVAAGAILSAKKALNEVEFKKMVGHTEVSLQPVGVAGHITPWNANILYFFNKASAALAAGCTVVTKPSEMSALQTQLIMECVHEAKIPAGLINIVNGRGDVVGAEITRNPDVAKISFTGSTAVGKTIARDGAATLKRVTLELGGKSPHIILEDANLEQVIPFVLSSGFMNSGQACIAGTRVLVPESRAGEIKAALKQAVEQHLKVGLPQDASTAIGPMVSKSQYERVQSYINKGIAEGAEVLVGGPGHPAGLESGNFVKPTLFANVTNDMTVAREEIFGPVLCLITYKVEQEAIAIANDTPYGLAGYVSGSDYDHAKRIADQIEAGTVSINAFNNNPAAPFGGFKQSGLGRENGVYGIHSYMEYKSIS